VPVSLPLRSPTASGMLVSWRSVGRLIAYVYLFTLYFESVFATLYMKLWYHPMYYVLGITVDLLTADVVAMVTEYRLSQ